MKPARIVDVTLAGARYDVMKAALDILTTAPEYDLILPVIGSSARFHPELAVKPIVDSAGAAKPLAACLVPDAPEALAMLSEAGVPNFRTPEACADADRRGADAGVRRGPRPNAVDAAPSPAPRPHARRARRRHADRALRHSARAGGGGRCRHHARAGAAVPLSGRGQGAVGRDRAQDRSRRRRARRRGRRRAAGGDPADPRECRATPAGTASSACWCSRWSRASARRWSAIASIPRSARW